MRSISHAISIRTSMLKPFESLNRLRFRLPSKSLGTLPIASSAEIESNKKAYQAEHDAAVVKGEVWYVDRSTGYRVMTELAHIRRGKCCGNVRLLPWNLTPSSVRKSHHLVFDCAQ